MIPNSVRSLLTSVVALVGQNCIFGVLAPYGRLPEFLFQLKSPTLDYSAHLRGLEAMVFRNGLGEIQQKLTLPGTRLWGGGGHFYTQS